MGRPSEFVKFNTARLVADLTTLGKWTAFNAQAASLGRSLSLDKYKRAKRGEATPATLATIAAILGHGVERYQLHGQIPIGSTQNLSGQWTALYLEAPRRGKPVRTWEKLLIRQYNNHIRGHYDFMKTDEPDAPGRNAVYLMRGLIVSDLITGCYWAEGRLRPDGIGTFQLKIEPSGFVAEGYCSFYGNDGLVAASHNFWIRNDGSHEAVYQLRSAEERILNRTIYFEVPSIF